MEGDGQDVQNWIINGDDFSGAKKLIRV